MSPPSTKWGKLKKKTLHQSFTDSSMSHKHLHVHYSQSSHHIGLYLGPSIGLRVQHS